MTRKEAVAMVQTDFRFKVKPISFLRQKIEGVELALLVYKVTYHEYPENPDFRWEMFEDRKRTAGGIMRKVGG